MNRRISLVVLNDKTERQIRGLPEQPIEEIENEADAAEVLGVGAAPADAPAGQEPQPAAQTEPAVPDAPPPDGERLAQPAAGRNPA
jgi:hypothetical protein